MAAHDDASDLRKPLRASATDGELSAGIDRAIGLKPKGHDYIIDRRHNRPSVSRHMSVRGGLVGIHDIKPCDQSQSEPACWPAIQPMITHSA